MKQGLAANVRGLCRAKAQRFYGPITVHQLFLTAPQPTFGATRVVDFQLLTTDFKAVTALSGSFGPSWEAEGTEGNSPAKAQQYMWGA